VERLVESGLEYGKSSECSGGKLRERELNTKTPCTHPWGLSGDIPVADALLINSLSLPLSFNVE
jgi:hypothetical protein